MRPSRARASSRTIANPIPSPPVLRARDRSPAKSARRCAAARHRPMPMPRLRPRPLTRRCAARSARLRCRPARCSAARLRVGCRRSARPAAHPHTPGRARAARRAGCPWRRRRREKLAHGPDRSPGSSGLLQRAGGITLELRVTAADCGLDSTLSGEWSGRRQETRSQAAAPRDPGCLSPTRLPFASFVSCACCVVLPLGLRSATDD
jgi:hypothetical protein